jgi:hypothetical protein
MNLENFLDRVKSNQPVDFKQTMAIITDYYHYQPAEFCNGLQDDVLINQAGSNEGSCKIFAFARLHCLDQQQTLNLFGDFYRVDVLTDSAGSGHQNIRRFMRYGWQGICFSAEPLTLK